MKRRSQKMRILEAMFRGEVINRLWASRQMPIIAQPGNRCNEILLSGVPVQKSMVYENKSKRMDYWLTQEYIQEVRNKIRQSKTS